MVFKRRQKATARTERGGGGESRGYCAQWTRLFHSTVKTKHLKSEEPKLFVDGEETASKMLS